MRKNSGNILLIVLAVVGIVTVSVGGYFWWVAQNQKIESISSAQNSAPINNFPTPTPVPTHSLAINPVANWKTYTNPFGNFSMRYPPELNVLHGTNFVGYPNNDYEIVPVFVKSTLSVDQWITQKVCPNFIDSKSCSEKKSGSVPNSIEFDTLNRHFASTETIFKQDDTIYQISLAAINPNVPIADSAKKTYDQILSTFKFLDQK